MNRNEIIDYVGAQDWDMVAEAFESKSLDAVKVELDEMFPTEDNAELAQAIVEALK